MTLRISENASARLITIGRTFFAIALIAWGLQHLLTGDLVTRVVPGGWAPAWAAAGSDARTTLAYAVGLLLIASGASILLGVRARAAALTMAILAGISLLVAHLPLAIAGPAWGGAWTAAGKALVMCGGALLIARVSSADAGRHTFASAHGDAHVVRFGRFALGAFMVLAGIQHFLFAPFVATLVPAWLPGALFWTWFAAVALIAGGLGLFGLGEIIAPRAAPLSARLAALLSGAMIFSWVFLVHIPRALAQPRNHGEIAAVFEALAFSGVAFLIAALVSGASRYFSDQPLR